MEKNEPQKNKAEQIADIQKEMSLVRFSITNLMNTLLRRATKDLDMTTLELEAKKSADLFAALGLSSLVHEVNRTGKEIQGKLLNVITKDEENELSAMTAELNSLHAQLHDLTKLDYLDKRS